MNGNDSNILSLIDKLNSIKTMSKYTTYYESSPNWKELDITNVDGTTLWGLEFDENRLVKSIYDIEGNELYCDIYYKEELNKIYLCVDRPIDCIVYELQSYAVFENEGVDRYVHDITITGRMPLGYEDIYSTSGGNFVVRFTMYNDRSLPYISLHELTDENGNFKGIPTNVRGYILIDYKYLSTNRPTICREIYDIEVIAPIAGRGTLIIHSVLTGNKDIKGFEYPEDFYGKGYPGVFEHNFDENDRDSVRDFVISDKVIRLTEVVNA